MAKKRKGSRPKSKATTASYDVVNEEQQPNSRNTPHETTENGKLIKYLQFLRGDIWKYNRSMKKFRETAPITVLT